MFYSGIFWNMKELSIYYRKYIHCHVQCHGGLLFDRIVSQLNVFQPTALTDVNHGQYMLHPS